MQLKGYDRTNPAPLPQHRGTASSPISVIGTPQATSPTTHRGTYSSPISVASHPSPIPVASRDSTPRVRRQLNRVNVVIEFYSDSSDDELPAVYAVPSLRQASTFIPAAPINSDPGIPDPEVTPRGRAAPNDRDATPRCQNTTPTISSVSSPAPENTTPTISSLLSAAPETPRSQTTAPAMTSFTSSPSPATFSPSSPVPFDGHDLDYGFNEFIVQFSDPQALAELEAALQGT